MVWPLAVMALGAMSSANKEQAASLTAQAQRAEQEGERAGLEGAQNIAIREANAKNFRQATLKAGLLNVQKAQQAQQLAQRRAEAGQDEIQALGSADVNAAASGTVGASVDAVRTDIQMQYDTVRGQISAENEINAQNFNTALYDLITGAQDANQSAVAISGIHKVGKVDKFSILASGAMAAGSKWASSKMDLGLGPATSASPTATSYAAPDPSRVQGSVR